MDEYVEVKIRKDFYDILAELDSVRKTQNNYYTATPIYLIQSRYWIPTVEEDADETFLIYFDDADGMTLSQINNGELEEQLRDDELNIPESVYDFLRESDSMEDIVDALIVEYQNGNYYDWEPYTWDAKAEWNTQAYFLTEEGALNYKKYQSHNLGKSRLYIDYIGYDNRGKFANLLSIIDGKKVFKED